MNENDLISAVLDAFGMAPTSDQLSAVRAFAQFMFAPKPETAMLLCGSAGTGKTSIAAAMVKTLHRLGHRTVLLAPTGRAAKVFSLTASMPAGTIHRKIYQQRTFSGPSTAFGLAYNRARNTLFVVDEASMISNQLASSAEIFGSGCLLDDLIQFVYSGDGCRLMLIGDKAQLPPVGLASSPALDAKMLQRYGLDIIAANLDEVLRQSRESGILFNATSIRRIFASEEKNILPKILLEGFGDVRRVTGDELIESINSSYSKAGIDGTMIVTRSNKTANIYNRGIRNMILGREAMLTVGDRLMVVKNNYYWTEKAAAAVENDARDDVATSPTDEPAFLANGDIAIVRRAGCFEELYGLHFADVTLAFPDYDGYEIDVKIILDSLASEAPALTREQQQQLFSGVLEDYAHIRGKRQQMKAVRDDKYYNAVQVKFAYAVTCHKAQGGQWEHVYIDQGFMSEAMAGDDYIHWLYTAFTRATEQLFLVNWPLPQIASPSSSND
ncbi:MAG: AAA family ATPase [Prevotella sp.]|nr:AAA family ATPase [Prevotella sp.]